MPSATWTKESAHSSRISIPGAINYALAALQVTVNALQFFLLPLYLLPISLWWALILLPLAALNNPFWALIHEAIHDLFHPSSRINATAGRLLAVFFGAPFRLLQITHLLHHKFNRLPQEQGTEVYDPRNVSRFKASIGYYFRLLGGLYLLEVLSPLIFFLPQRVLRICERRMLADPTNQHGGSVVKYLLHDEKIQQMRIDSLVIMIVFGLSFFCYGEHWKILLGILLARGFLISFLDNVYHYNTPMFDVSFAQNLDLSRFLSRLLLNHNFHGIHHKNPNISWIRLPGLFIEHAARFEGNYFTAAVVQLCGPVALSQLPPQRVPSGEPASVATFSRRS